MDPTGIIRIAKISICHSEVIDSLAICFERNGFTQCTNRWDRDGGNIIEVPISKSALCGGSGGLARDMDDVSAISKIYGVKIRHDDTIHALSVHYKLHDLSLKETPLWGGETKKLTEIYFGPYEYITSVRGHVGYFDDIFTVRSLQLISNWKCYGPYGKEEGTPFELSDFGGRIIGFHGRSGEYLDAIGVYVKEFTAKLQISKSVPCGGSGGLARDTDDMSAIYRICAVKIRYDDTIHALSVRYKLHNYNNKETPFWGSKTGKLTEIEFNREDEYIKSVRGYVGYFGDIFTVRSLELITNKKCYGPYGKEEGTPFELSAFGGNIIGFHGRSGAYLNAIGVYVQWDG